MREETPHLFVPGRKTLLKTTDSTGMQTMAARLQGVVGISQLAVGRNLKLQKLVSVATFMPNIVAAQCVTHAIDELLGESKWA